MRDEALTALAAGIRLVDRNDATAARSSWAPGLGPASANCHATPQVRTMTAIDLVHGLWADGSGWSETVTEFHALGHESVAAQLPLESMADDIAAIRRALSTRWLYQ